MKSTETLPVLEELKKQLEFHTVEALKIRSAIEILTGAKAISLAQRQVYSNGLPARIFNILDAHPKSSAIQIRDRLLEEKAVAKNKKRRFSTQVYAALNRLLKEGKLKGDSSGYTIVGKRDKGY